MGSEDRIVETLCRLCEPGCGVTAHIRGGRLVKTTGMPAHPTSRGLLCIKGESAPQIVHAPERLTAPLLRVGPRGEQDWQSLSWEQALGILAERMTGLRDRHGPESLALFRGQAGDWGAPWQYALRFMFAFGSPNTSTPSHICYFPRVAAENLTYGRFTDPDYKNARTIVEWGACRADTHLPAWFKIQDAQRRGARLVVVDPVRTGIARKADLWLQIRPGTDGALALGLMHVLLKEDWYDREFVERWTEGFQQLAALVAEFTPQRVAEITWIPADRVREAAHAMRTGGSTAIYAGNGLEHHTNTFQTLRAIACLRAMAGTIDVPGGNIFLTLLNWVHMEGQQFLAAGQKAKRVGGYDLFTDMSFCVPFPAIVDSILTEEPYPIRGLMVIGGNPAVTMPNQDRVQEALRKLELLVVLDPLMTRTARLADLVLPASTQFEKTDLIASTIWGEFGDFALLKTKALDIEGCRADWWFLFNLARRLGLEAAFPWSNVEEAIDFQLASSGLTAEQLAACPSGVRFKRGEESRKYLRDGFATRSGKVEFYSRVLEERGYDPLPTWREPAESPISQPRMAREYPLIGCSAGKTVNYVHSQFRHVKALREREPDPWVRIHPDDAGERQVEHGDWVRIRSSRGNIRMRATVTDAVMPGVASISPHWGEADPASNMNVLIDDSARDPVVGSTGDRSFLCQVEKEGRAEAR
jgi:anaerobic selenocysteine-containing dehydrogenase